MCSFRNLHSFMDWVLMSWTWCQVRRAFWTSWWDLFEYRPQKVQVTNQYPGTSGPTSLVLPSNFCHQESTRWWTWATCRQQCLCLNIFQVPSWSYFLVLGWRWISICLFISTLMLLKSFKESCVPHGWGSQKSMSRHLRWSWCWIILCCGNLMVIVGQCCMTHQCRQMHTNKQTN